MEKKISVVIRAFNEERWLEPLLVALRAQTMKNLEIILVDSGSVDSTRDVAARYCDSVVDIETDSFSYGYALNFGIGRATADLVAILSAHTLPIDNRWIEHLSAPFGDNAAVSGLALTYGGQRGNHVTKLSEQTDFLQQFPDRSRRQIGRDYFCNNANALIRRDLWQEHPFDQRLPGLEDMAWAKHWMDRGYAIEYVAEGGILHIHEETWPQVYRRFRREAIAARMAGIDLPGHANVVVTETRRFASDLVHAFGQGRLKEIGQVVRYRYWKTLGRLEGLVASLDSFSEMPEEEGDVTYRALEVQGQNQARMVVHRLTPLRPNEVLIRVSYVGICQTDLEVLRATLGYFRDGTARWPLVPGHEYSGVVVKKGANVEAVAVGDAVVGECILSCGVCAECLANRQTACRQRREVGVVNYNGACAEFLVLPARFVHRLPEGLSLLSAATVEPLAVAMKGLRRVGLVQAREAGRSRVLVVGAGALGNLCAQVAHHFGHRVTTMDRLPARLKHLEGICEATVTSIPPLHRFEYVIEATGMVDAVEQVLSKSHTGCNVLLMGFPYGPIRWNPEAVVAQDKRIVGSVGSDYDMFEAAIRILPSLNLHPFNEKVLELNDWEVAYKLHESKEHLKIKLRVAPPPDGPRRSGAAIALHNAAFST